MKDLTMADRDLCEAGGALSRRERHLAGLLGYDPGELENNSAFLAEVLARAIPDETGRGLVREIARDYFAPDGDLAATVREDVAITAARDGDPGGDVATLLFGNGLHALLGHRLAHAVLRDDLETSAHALKIRFLRAFGADIMPPARIGRRVWLDHALGLVIGQTAIIEDDVSIWHGVTLGTNLVVLGAARHPRLRRGCVIGAHAQLIGPIEIGEGAVVAAGAVVTQSVPALSIAVGVKARVLEGRARPGLALGIPPGETS
jgi:serine O-acetyltransferase